MTGDIPPILLMLFGLVCGFFIACGWYKQKGVKNLEAALAKERELSKEKSHMLDRQQGMLSIYQWKEGPAPGGIWHLVQTKHSIHIAKLVGNPCVWIDARSDIIYEVIAWRSLL